jgi:hypothetical protein
MTVQHHSPRASRTRGTSHPATVPDPGAVDARLAGLLESKPADDPIPLSAWWFVATTLQSAVVVRRVMEGVEPAPARGIGHEVTRAQAAARAALEELDERAVEPHTSSDRPFLRMEPLSVLRFTIHQLAVMAVRSRATPVPQLARALVAHVRCCHAAKRHGAMRRTVRDNPLGLSQSAPSADAEAPPPSRIAQAWSVPRPMQRSRRSDTDPGPSRPDVPRTGCGARRRSGIASSVGTAGASFLKSSDR